MPRSLNEYYYWDSSVFLARFNNEPGRAEVVGALWQEVSKSRDLRIATSTLAIVEVASTSGRASDVDIDAYLDRPEVHLVEATPARLRQARSLMRRASDDGWSLKPYDAVHLATAAWLNEHAGVVREVNTYDGKWFRYGALLGDLSICKPHVIQPGLFSDDPPA